MRNSANVQTSVSKTWNLARKAPFFTKRSRAHSIVNRQAFKIAAAGCGVSVTKNLREDASRFRLNLLKESNRAPFVPTFTEGAISMIEQHLVCAIQEATTIAGYVREAGSKKRISADIMEYAMKHVIANMTQDHIQNTIKI